MIEITWNYAPADFFEAELVLPLLTGNVTFGQGTAKFATHVHFAVSRGTIASVTDYVRAVLDSRLILDGRLYSLSEPQSVEIDLEGKRHYALFADSTTHEVRAQNVDLIHTAKAGTVIQDTRLERITAHAVCVSTIGLEAAYSATLRQMLWSFRRSLEDPGNALVYLYEIRDAAATHFGGDRLAQESLDVSNRCWSRLAN